ncbi:MAG: nucleoside transporter C-terminal domain-containing protein [Candidatus Omnitrophota bacterium]
MDVYNFVSLAGIFILLVFAWSFSPDKRNINWKVVIWGIAIQVFIAVFIFIVPVGEKVFLIINGVVVKGLDSAMAGTKFLFGRLSLAPGMTGANGETSLGFILAFQALPTIVFFSAMMSILYFCGIMPKIIGLFSRVFTRLMKISGAESLVASSNIFVGVESALTAKPYLGTMTSSELCTVLTCGMATVASNILAVYVFSLKTHFPTIAGHLISASLLSVPAAIVMSKLIMPESEVPVTISGNVKAHYEKENNLFESIINGANSGIKMIFGIAALLLAVLGLVALFDLFLGGIGSKINVFFNCQFDWSLKNILGYIFYPFTLIIGVPVEDAGIISQIIGERTILTEVVAYQDLAGILKEGLLAHPRSAVLATYALCGFAHIASLAIFIGGIVAIVPEKTRILGSLGLRALLGATLACLMTACVAGVFFTGKTLLFSL